MFNDSSPTTTIDELETSFLAHERVIARLRAEQMQILQRLDTAQVANADGCKTLSEWVAGRLDVTQDRAATLVQASRRTSAHPETAEALANGDCSFDRAEATLRLAESGADEATIRDSRGFDIAGVRRLAARHRVVTPVDEVAAFEGRHLVLQPNLDESSWRLFGTLAGYEGRIVDKALMDAADEFPSTDGTRAQRNADALTAICVDHLDSAHSAEAGRTGPPIVTLHADLAALGNSGAGAGIAIDVGPKVGLATLERVLCEGAVELNVTDDDGTPLALGRTTRAITPRLRRFVLQRDGGCSADGCSSRYRLQPHHITPWSEGGRTDPENLTTLCWYHHHVVVHGRGFRIDSRSPRGRRRFTRAPHRDPP